MELPTIILILIPLFHVQCEPQNPIISFCVGQTAIFELDLFKLVGYASLYSSEVVSYDDDKYVCVLYHVNNGVMS